MADPNFSERFLDFQTSAGSRFLALPRDFLPIFQALGQALEVYADVVSGELRGVDLLDAVDHFSELLSSASTSFRHVSTRLEHDFFSEVRDIYRR